MFWLLVGLAIVAVLLCIGFVVSFVDDMKQGSEQD